MEAQTGFVLSVVGGSLKKKSEFNRAIQAERQPGSSFKPIIFGAALERGFTPATVIVDSPIVYSDADSGKWKPNNFEEKFYGDTTFRQALVKSRNVPTIKIVQAVGVPFILEYTKRIGMVGKLNSDLSISLGSGGFSLVEMTRTYALFPRLGRQVKPIFYTSVRDREGKVLEEHLPQPAPLLGRTGEKIVSIAPLQVAPLPSATPTAQASPASLGPGPVPSELPGISGRSQVRLAGFPNAGDPAQVMDPRAAYVMSHLMKEVVNYGTGHDAKSLGRPAAGKTGTTNENIDAWFIGFTPHVVTGAWVGYDSQKTMGSSETGAKAALPIWLGLMKEAVKPYPDSDFLSPPGIVFASIDITSGKLAAAQASSAIREAFIEGTEPVEVAAGASGGGSSSGSSSDFLKDEFE